MSREMCYRYMMRLPLRVAAVQLGEDVVLRRPVRHQRGGEHEERVRQQLHYRLARRQPHLFSRPLLCVSPIPLLASLPSFLPFLPSLPCLSPGRKLNLSSLPTLSLALCEWSSQHTTLERLSTRPHALTSVCVCARAPVRVCVIRGGVGT